MFSSSLKNQTVLITGASSGIGQACAKDFASLGANLVITARRLDRLEEMAKELSQHHNVKVWPYKLDVRNLEQVKALYEQLKKEAVTIDILVNNAGLGLSVDKIQDGKIENWEVMIDTNFKGLLYMTRLILPQMIAKNKGHIINIGSVAGQDCYISGNIYCATKHAVKAVSRSLRLDLLGTKIRISEIDPGAVKTEFNEVRLNDKEKAKELYQGFKFLAAEDIASAVAYAATRPEHVNISEMTIYPQAQASVHHIYRD